MLERDRSFPSARLYLYLPLQSGGVRGQKQKPCRGQRPGQPEVLPGQQLGPLTKPGRLGGASLPRKPCQNPHFPQGSAETRLVVLGAAAKHLPHTEMTSSGTLCFLTQESSRGGRARLEIKRCQQSFVIRQNPTALDSYLSGYFFPHFPLYLTLSEMTGIQPKHPFFPIIFGN